MTVSRNSITNGLLHSVILLAIGLALQLIHMTSAFPLGHEKPSEPANRVEAGLTGPVHLVEEQSRRGRDVTEYDPNGMSVREYFESIESDGIVSSRQEIIFEHDLDGKRVRKKMYLNGMVVAIEAYAYETGGHLSGAVVTNAEGIFEEAWFYSYDKHGHRLRRISYTGGNVGYAIRADHEFDERGREVAKYLIYPSDEEKNHKIKMTYDELNRLVELNLFDDQGRRVSQSKYRYSERGEVNILSEYYVSDVQSELRESFENDDRGNWIKWEQTSCRKQGKNQEMICQNPSVRSRTIRYHGEGQSKG